MGSKRWASAHRFLLEAHAAQLAPLLGKKGVKRSVLQGWLDPVATWHQSALAGGVTREDQRGIGKPAFALGIPRKGDRGAAIKAAALRAQEPAEIHDVAGAADGGVVFPFGLTRPTELRRLDLCLQLLIQDRLVLAQDLRHPQLQLIGIPASQVECRSNLNGH